jgi:hypothetical protein
VVDVLHRSGPVLAELGDAIAGARVVVVPGNHDHQLAAERLERRRRSGRSRPLPLEEVTKPGRSDLIAKVARQLGVGEVALAYPGIWVRPDVYATHGHYLDCHNTVPSLEVLAAAVTARLLGRLDRAGGTSGEGLTPDSYEAALGPIYAFTYGLAQGVRPARSVGGGGLSLAIWERVNRDDRRLDPARMLLGRVLVPGAVAGVNAAGLGPFRADLSAGELRRAALRAMRGVVERLGIHADHVVFGHTHRSGPLAAAGDREVDGWSLPGGARLVNSGSWVHEPAFIGDRGQASPYWPGTCVIVEDGGPPRLERLLERLPRDRDGPQGPTRPIVQYP